MEDLPPGVRFDVLNLQLRDAHEDKRHDDVLKLIERLRGEGFETGPEIDLYEAQARYALGDRTASREALVRYLNTAERNGENYQAALRLFVDIETWRKTAADRAQAEADQEAGTGRGTANPPAPAGKAVPAEAASAAPSEADTPARPPETASAKHADAPDDIHADWARLNAQVEGWRRELRTVGAGGGDIGWALARKPDGGFLFAGSYEQLPDAAKEHEASRLPWVLSFDAEGRLLWTRAPGPPAPDGAFHSVAALSNGDILYGGLHRGTLFAMKTDAKGMVVPARPGIPWVIPYGRPGTTDDTGLVRMAPDGDVLAFGAGPAEEEDSEGPVMPYVVRIGPDGNILARTVFRQEDGAQWHTIADALVLADGGAVLVGEARTAADAAEGAAYVLRIGADGTKLWEYRIAPEAGQRARLTAVTTAPDDGLLTVGRNGDELLVLGLDAGGNPWPAPAAEDTDTLRDTACSRPLDDYRQAVTADLRAEETDGADIPEIAQGITEGIARVYGHACGTDRNFLRAVAVHPRADNGYLVLSAIGGEGRDADLRLTALDAAGRMTWQRQYGHDGDDFPGNLLSTADGGYIVAGTTDSVGEGGHDLMMFKVDRNGNPAAWTALAPPERPAVAPSPAAAPVSPAPTETPAPESPAAKPSLPDGERGSDADGAGKADTAPEEMDEGIATDAAPELPPDSSRPAGKAAIGGRGTPAQPGGDVPEIDLFKVLGDLFAPKDPASPEEPDHPEPQ